MHVTFHGISSTCFLKKKKRSFQRKVGSSLNTAATVEALMLGIVLGTVPWISCFGIRLVVGEPCFFYRLVVQKWMFLYKGAVDDSLELFSPPGCQQIQV